MKRKLLLTIATLLCAVGTWADEEDYTSYIRNANLESKDGWTFTVTATGSQNWSDIDGSSPSYVVEAYAGWGSIEISAYSMKQNVTLPAGKYRAEGYAFYRYGLNHDTDASISNASFVAGDFSTKVVTLGGETLGGQLTSYPNSRGEASTAFTNGYYKKTLEFSIEKESTIEFGYEGTHTLKQSWFIAGPIKLYRTGDFDYSVYQAQLEGLVDDAKALQGEKMNASVSTALDDVVTAYDGKSYVSTASYKEAFDALNAAIANAETSIANYAAIKAVMDANTTNVSTYLDSYGSSAYATAAATAIAAYDDGTATNGSTEIAALKAAYKTAVLDTKQPQDGADMTAYITNPDFDGGNYVGWTRDIPYGGNCAIQGGSRMEYWAGSSSNRLLASFDISQELTDLPQGAYTVSAEMYNSLNGESGKEYWGEEGKDHPVFSPTCGVYGSSNNEEVALVTSEGDVLTKYTTDEILVFRGRMTIGTKNTVTPMVARWFVFDNVKLTYSRQLTQDEIDANTIPTSIYLDPTSADLTMYGTRTLTPTILPSNANDKTVTWTSSNTAVATVSPAGVVTAVGVGSATITATANGADGVYTTASITVSDVVAADAPAYYSSIAAGDFYIVNAATGKYLGGANAWGTQASLIEHGIPFTAASSDGKYTLDSHTYNNETDHFLNGTYVDGASTNLYITSLGSGKYSISTADGSAYLTAKPGSTVVDNTAVNATSTLAQWYFVSKSNRDKTLEDATDLAPVDATYYIKEANISRNLRVAYGESGWTNIGYGQDKNQENSNYNAEVYNGTVNVYQTITGIPNGTYTLKMQGFSNGTDVKLYANSTEIGVQSKPDGITTQSGAAAAFTDELYVNTLSSVTVTNHTLKIGLKGDCSGSKWLCYDNFELYMTAYIPAPVTIGSTGYTTLASTEKLDLDHLPDDLEAYYITGASGDYVTLTPATGKVPAGEGLIMKGTAGSTYTIPVTDESTTALSGNKLVGCTEETSVAKNASKYVLVNNEGTAEFQNLEENAATIPAGKAYLDLSGAAAKARLAIVLDGEANDIDEVEIAEEGDDDAPAVNVAGQTVGKDYKGIVIKAGKKYLQR